MKPPITHQKLIATLRDFPRFLDRVKAALPDSIRPGVKSVAPLASGIGASESQVREWVIARKYTPSGPVAFRMLIWLLTQESKSKPSSKS